MGRSGRTPGLKRIWAVKPSTRLRNLTRPIKSSSTSVPKRSSSVRRQRRHGFSSSSPPPIPRRAMSGGGCSVRAIWILTPHDTVAFSRYPSELFPVKDLALLIQWGSPLPSFRQAVRGSGEAMARLLGSGGRRWRRGGRVGRWGDDAAAAAAGRPRGRCRLR